MSEYCGRLKCLGDTIYDCGAAVSEPTLVINTLCGLNNKFSMAIAVLSTMLHDVLLGAGGKSDPPLPEDEGIDDALGIWHCLDPAQSRCSNSSSTGGVL